MSTRKSAFDFFFLKILPGSKMLLFQELCYVTTWFRDCHFDVSVSSNVRYVACSNGTDCHAESRLEFSVSKWLKLTQFHLFTPLFDWKKEFCNGKTYKKYKKASLWAVNIYFCAFRNWKCSHNYRRPTMKIPELRWCLTEITFSNPSQFPSMF